MVRREKDMPVETRDQMRGGKGNVVIRHLEKELLPKKGRLFSKLILAPGCSIGMHEHVGETELFYFASGQGVVVDDGKSISVAAGDAMTTVSGHSHAVENTGTEDLVIIASIVLE